MSEICDVERRRIREAVLEGQPARLVAVRHRTSPKVVSRVMLESVHDQRGQLEPGRRRETPRRNEVGAIRYWMRWWLGWSWARIGATTAEQAQDGAKARESAERFADRWRLPDPRDLEEWPRGWEWVPRAAVARGWVTEEDAR